MNSFSAEATDYLDGGRVVMTLDLGVGGLYMSRRFRIWGIKAPYAYEDFDTSEKAKEFLKARLDNAEEIFVSPVSDYVLDVSYRMGDLWYNMADAFQKEFKYAR